MSWDEFAVCTEDVPQEISLDEFQNVNVIQIFLIASTFNKAQAKNIDNFWHFDIFAI